MGQGFCTYFRVNYVIKPGGSQLEVHVPQVVLHSHDVCQNLVLVTPAKHRPVHLTPLECIFSLTCDNTCKLYKEGKEVQFMPTFPDHFKVVIYE
jgi:hypothetical protein